MSEETTPAQPDASQGGTSQAGTPAVGLLVAAYVDERGADKALQTLKQAKQDGQFYYEDAAVVRRDAEGKVHINETGDMSAGKGAGIGAVLGGVIGLLGGPAGVAIGASAGAALGAAITLRDAGFDNESLKAIGGALPSGTSALAVTTSQAFIEAIRAQSPQRQNLTIAKEIAAEIRDRLNARQDLLLAMVFTENGFAASRIVSSPSELAVFDIVATDEGVVAVAGVANGAGVTVARMVAGPAGGEAGAAAADQKLSEPAAPEKSDEPGKPSQS